MRRFPRYRILVMLANGILAGQERNDRPVGIGKSGTSVFLSRSLVLDVGAPVAVIAQCLPAGVRCIKESL